jgi:hypothetical protein
MKKDSYVWGAIMGVILPLILFLLVSFISGQSSSGTTPWLENQKLLMLSLIPNIILIRYYLVSLKADKTGRALLFSTSVILVFALFLPLLESKLL